MATYLVLINFTDQGIRTLKDSPKRADDAKELAQSFGLEIRETFWTLGAYDGALLLDAPDEAALTAWALKVGSLGNVRTQTLRAFSAGEFELLIRKIRE